MSVLECNRINCDNIMCDRLSHEHGYICHECFEELVSTGPITNVDDFMNMVKRPNDIKEAEARYNVVFPLQEYS